MSLRHDMVLSANRRVYASLVIHGDIDVSDWRRLIYQIQLLERQFKADKVIATSQPGPAEGGT